MLKASTDNSTTGTSTISATRIAGGAGAVVAAGAATVNSNSAGSVNTTSVRAQLSRTAGGAFSDRVLIPNPSRFAFNTGSHTIVATVRGAQIAGGAGAVVAAGSATVNSNGAGAVNTTGVLAQLWCTGAFDDQMPIPMASRSVFKTGTGKIVATGRGAQTAGAVMAARATAGNTNSAGTVNTTDLLARTPGDAFSDQMLNPRPSGFHITAGTRSVIIINSDAAQIATGTGAVNAAGAAAVSSQSAGAVNRYKPSGFHITAGTVSNIVINSDAQIANGTGAVIAAGAAAVDSQSAGAVNRYNGIVVSQPTRRMICFVLGVAVGLSKIDAISFVLGVAVSLLVA